MLGSWGGRFEFGWEEGLHECDLAYPDGLGSVRGAGERREVLHVRLGRQRSVRRHSGRPRRAVQGRQGRRLRPADQERRGPRRVHRGRHGQGRGGIVRRAALGADALEVDFQRCGTALTDAHLQYLQHLNKAQVQLIADASDPNVANTLTNYATAIIVDYQQRITNDRKLPYTIDTETKMLYNPELKGAYNFVPGVMAMVLLLVCTMMTAITIVKEKEMGTMEVMLVSPMKPLMVVIAKAIPYLMLSAVNITSILLLSVFVLGVPVNGSLVLLAAESVLFTLVSLSLGLLISSGAESQQTAMFISLVALFLPTVMLSGFMFPVENMPLPLRIVSNIVPAKWYYIIVKSVMVKGTGLHTIWKETLILAGMMLFFLILAIKNFKIRLA